MPEVQDLDTIVRDHLRALEADPGDELLPDKCWICAKIVEYRWTLNRVT